jgi:hypothetical protein
VAVNASAETAQVVLPVAGPADGRWGDLLNPPEETAASAGTLTLEIPPRWARVMAPAG